MLEIVILAAGKGTRMYSSKPKVLHDLAGKSFLSHVISCSKSLNANKIHTVIGHGAALVRQSMAAEAGLNFVEQTEQLGTGHAVQQAMPYVDNDAVVLILYGDVPLIKPETLEALIANVSNTSMALLTVKLDDPSGYGRIIRDFQGDVSCIVEQKDASKDQLSVSEVNTGVMAVRASHLQSWLPDLKNANAQGEYYLTDVIAMAVAAGVSVETTHPSSEFEVLGVNNRQQQAVLERIYQEEQADNLLALGLSLKDPKRFDCRGHLSVGKDCMVDVNCIFEGEVTLGDDVTIGPNCWIKDALIDDGATIEANSVIESAKVGKHCTVGPFGRLRPGAELQERAKIGNFVEVKKSTIGVGSKVNHLSYVGDADIGRNVNLGAGTITCNYDGVNKFKTTIEDDVFVGSNTAIVAPVTLESESTIGAGSVISRNVSAGKLSLTRSPQKTIEGWLRPKKKD